MGEEQRSRWLPSPPDGTAHWLVQAIQRAFKFIYALQDQISSGLGITILELPHADRFLGTYAATKFAIGSLFVETDRDGVTYVDRKDPGSPGGQGWFWLSGDWHSVLSDRPTDLGLRDTGYIFTASDTGVTYRWNGTSWTWVSGVWRDIFANIPGRTGSANAVPSSGESGLLFYATDTKILWRWNGTKWQYLAGTEKCTQSTIPDLIALSPGGLWLVDEYRAWTVDHEHAYQYDFGSLIWRFAPGDAGTRWIIAVPSNVAPYGGVWGPCDGGSVTIAIDSFASGGSSTLAVTTQVLNQSGSEPVAIFGSNSPSAVIAATAGAIDPAHQQTSDELSNHAHAIVMTVEVQSGTGAFPAATGFTDVENAVHQHDLVTSADVQLLPPSVGNGGLPKHISLQWWMRA